MQSLVHAWNRFVCVLKSCATFIATLQRAHAEAIRREQQKGRRSTSVCTAGIKTTAAFHTEQNTGRRFTKSKKDRDMPKVMCYNCNRLGHFARNSTNDLTLPSTKKESASRHFQ